MKILDSSFLISFYLTEDSNHNPALKLVEKNKNETLLLSDIILYETLTVLNYKRNILFAKEVHSELTSNKNIRFFHLTDSEKDEILEAFLHQKKKLSFSDASVVYLAQKSKSEALAFDGNIQKSIKET